MTENHGIRVAIFITLFMLGIAKTDLRLEELFEEPDFQDLPAVVTWYDPSLCTRPGATADDMINCDSNPEFVADGTRVTEDLYGVTAACDQRLLGRIIKIGELEFRCRDTGGMIRPMWSKHYDRWVLYFDVMMHENPEWNYWLWEKWSVVN